MNGVGRPSAAPPDKCNLKTNKRMKNILSLLLILVCLAQCGAAEGQYDGYKRGWIFQHSDSTLTLYDTYKPYWGDLNGPNFRAVKRVTISEGVTSAKTWNIEGEYLPEVKSISFPKSLEKVDGPRFYRNRIEWGGKQELIEADTVYAPWETPVDIDNDIFARALSSPKKPPLLIVPFGCIDAYKNSDWSRIFAYIGDAKGPYNWPIYIRDWSLSDEGKLLVSKDFRWADNLEIWYTFEEGQIQSIELEEGMTKVGAYAFSGDFIRRVHSLTLPKSLKSIGKYAFQGIGSKCSDPVEINVPEGLTEIEDGTFEIAHISSFKFPMNIRSIGRNAFNGCKNLCEETGKLVLPPYVKKIEPGAFSFCQALNHVVLPASVDSVGGEAFGNIVADIDFYGYETTYLHDLRIDCYAPNPPEIYGQAYLTSSVLGYIGGSYGDLYVPAKSVEKYKASYWAREFNIYALDPEDNPYTAIRDVEDGKLKVDVRGGVVSVEGVDEFDVYDMSGRKMPTGRPLPAGVYVVTTGTGSERVVVK